MRHVKLALVLLAAVLICGVVAWRVQAEKFGNCFPLAGGACARIAIPLDTVLSANCTVGELMSTSVTVTGCTTAPCLCLCNTPNHWTCGVGPV